VKKHVLEEKLGIKKHVFVQIFNKTAWFMSHRIRYAMQQPQFRGRLKGIIEVDETYVGGKPRRTQKGAIKCRGTKKTPVVALVQRSGFVKSQVMTRLTGKNLKEFVYENVDNTAVVMTDEFKSYKMLRKNYQHKTIRHDLREYVRGQVHTNTVEGYFSLLKRGITGVFHHVSKKHLHRYLSEFDFRYNMRKQNDGVLAVRLLNGVEVKRLLYRDSSSVA